MEKIKKNRFSKVLVLLLAVMMIFTMMPSMAFAAETADMPILQNAENGAGDADASQSPDAGKNAEGQPENGQIQLTLSGMHSAQVASLKLYAYDGSQKGTTDLLSGITAVDGAYTVSLDAGSYWVEGYDANGDCNGGMSITADESHKEFKIQRIYEIVSQPLELEDG